MCTLSATVSKGKSNPEPTMDKWVHMAWYMNANKPKSHTMDNTEKPHTAHRYGAFHSLKTKGMGGRDREVIYWL
jgi:hypothetical protein